eukprot:3922023-Pleurochrysis_carterae.AAC.2
MRASDSCEGEAGAKQACARTADTEGPVDVALRDVHLCELDARSDGSVQTAFQHLERRAHVEIGLNGAALVVQLRILALARWVV